MDEIIMTSNYNIRTRTKNDKSKILWGRILSLDEINEKQLLLLIAEESKRQGQLLNGIHSMGIWFVMVSIIGLIGSIFYLLTTISRF